MPKYIVEMSRRFVQNEVAEMAVDAANKTAARKIAKQTMDNDTTGEAIAWEASDGDYDRYDIEDVVEQSRASADTTA